MNKPRSSRARPQMGAYAKLLRRNIAELIEQGDKTAAGEGLTFSPGDDPVSKEIEHALSARQLSRLNDSIDALKRIDDGSYGICLKCAMPIPLQRLEAIPETAHCIDCREKLERGISLGDGGDIDDSLTFIDGSA